MSIDKRIKLCEQIAKDVENDAAEFDGKPFSGRTVAQYFGNHGAAIAALADLIKEVLKEQKQTQLTEIQTNDKLE